MRMMCWKRETRDEDGEDDEGDGEEFRVSGFRVSVLRFEKNEGQRE